MRTPEILAPAGSMESLLAALRCGADAVYVGGKSFSARQRAENFDAAQLKEAARLCHLYDAKLYLTVNTLVFDSEFPALDTWIEEAVSCGIDAVLVQDLGVLHRIRAIAPDLPIHASTQMTIHTPQGAAWAKAHSISRVVVSRELSRKEIAAVCQMGLEVEVFVHGALCMSVSGQCGLSAVIGSRSANRGRCAQACRLPFSAAGEKNACALSLKDLCLVPYVQELTQMGVSSLKIEGRCKRPEYVAAAVNALVQARNGQEPDLDTLRAVFSRSGFTDGYYTGVRKNMFGTRQKEDVLLAKDVLPKLEHLYQKPPSCVPLHMAVSIQAGTPVSLTASDSSGATVTITGEIPQPAKTKATDQAQLERQLGKLGGTIYTLQTLTSNCDGVSMLPASALNALRRDCTAAMDEARIQMRTPAVVCRPAPIHQKKPVHTPVTSPLYRIALSTWTKQAEALLANENVDCLLLPISAAETVPAAYRDRVQLTLPRFCAEEAHLTQQLRGASEGGFSAICCENLSHLMLGRQFGFRLHGGMGLNLTNSESLLVCQQEGLTDVLLSPELTTAQARVCTGLSFGVYAYGNQPVMTVRNCPIQAEVGCRRCQHQLTDRTGRTFPVYCDRSAGTATMYNAVPTWMADKQKQLAFCQFLLLDCTLAEDPLSVLQAYVRQTPASFPTTRGLFYRGVE